MKEGLDKESVGVELSTVIAGLAHEGHLIRVTEEGDGKRPSKEERYEVSGVTIGKTTRCAISEVRSGTGGREAYLPVHCRIHQAEEPQDR